MILAIVLSALVLIGWSFLSDRLFPVAQPQSQKVEDGKVKPVQPARSKSVDATKRRRRVNVVTMNMSLGSGDALLGGHERRVLWVTSPALRQST